MLPVSLQEAGDSRGSTQGRNFGYEGKLRGGLPRTISAPILAHAAKWAGPHETPALSRCAVMLGADALQFPHSGMWGKPHETAALLSYGVQGDSLRTYHVPADTLEDKY